MAPSLSHERIMKIGFGFWASKVLFSALELGVFSELAKAPADEPTLVRRLGLNGRGAADFLDALVALGLLEREGRIYRNAPEAALYLDRAKPTYIGGLLEMADRRLYPYWGRLSEGLRSGKPQNEARDGGPDPFKAIYADPATLASFLGAMTGVSRPVAEAAARAFPWHEVKSFADIGCAQGGFAATLALAHPHLSGIGFDLKPVQPIFERFMAEQGLGQRVRFLAGDFFADPLPRAEVIVMGHILHDWDLSTKRMLIAKVYDALPAGGRFLAYDAMIDDDRRTRLFGLLMSLNMLIETPGGFDYTGADCIGWMRAAGFKDAVSVPLTADHAMVVGTK